MQPVTRFAPSPTGRLHLGHAFSAVLAHDYARPRDGVFLLRIEDIDPARSRTEHVDSILEDLLWLGLEWDGEITYQSERLELYDDALRQLKQAALVYPCFCTRSEILREITGSASAPHGDGIEPVYPGTCRRLDPDQREEWLAGRPHAWRLDMARAVSRAGPLFWTDHGRAVAARPERHGDVVIARKDAPTSYHLAVTIDDARQGVTHVVRGRDLFEATHVHRLVQALLDLPVPEYRHHPLIGDRSGRRLAKRHGAPEIAALRAEGADPAELVARLRDGRFPGGFSLIRETSGNG